MRSAVTYHDPGRMTAEARLAEIGRILGVGYARLFSQKRANVVESFAPKSPDGSAKKKAKEVA
jgi:hypothetical protein